MSEYAQGFAKHDIDASVLRELTDQDLKDLGVLLGHRRKLLRAIRDISRASIAVTARARATELSTKLDPEDMRAVIGANQKCVAEAVTRFGGFIAKCMSDGVLIYFGDPGRTRRTPSALCGLAWRSPKRQVAHPRAAPGAHRGGDRLGRSGRSCWSPATLGRRRYAENLAARLQAMAEPNTLGIAEGTRRLRLTPALADYLPFPGRVVTRSL
jgi:class 3 adenylate cyclase